MNHPFIYPFVEKPCGMPTSAPIYRVMEKLMAGGKLTTGTDDGWDGFKHKDASGSYVQRPGYDISQNDYYLFSELHHPDAYRHGIYKLGGYIFDFRPFFKKYLVKTKHNGWNEHWAPNKTFIRKCATFPRDILQIIEMPS